MEDVCFGVWRVGLGEARCVREDLIEGRGGCGVWGFAWGCVKVESEDGVMGGLIVVGIGCVGYRGELVGELM